MVNKVKILVCIVNKVPSLPCSRLTRRGVNAQHGPSAVSSCPPSKAGGQFRATAPPRVLCQERGTCKLKAD